jgi:hypothetical protein
VFIDRKIILKWPLLKEGEKLWTGLSWLAVGFSGRLLVMLNNLGVS